MRALKIAAIVGVGMTIAGVAFAGPWNDPAGRVNFTAPSGWVTEAQHSPPSQTTVLTGNANNECYVFTSRNAGTASAPPNRVHALTDQMSSTDWQALANVNVQMFPHHNAAVMSQSVDTSSFWPLQIAQLSGAERPVLAALSHRPGGLDLVAMCWTYGGPDATATYQALFHSLGNPGDATWQAAASQQDAAQSAAQQAAAAQASQQAQQAEQQTQAQREAARGRNGHARGEGPALRSPD
jgi:hypothetical protein